MFATIKSLIPEPRQADQPRHYVGRHRQPETVAARAAVPVIPAPAAPADGDSPATAAPVSAAPVSSAPVSAAPVSGAPAPAAATAPHEPGEPADGTGPKAS
jgi:hypothetical protein